MTGTYVVRTLGCKANLHDSQLIEAELQRQGWKPAPEAFSGIADLCIVNSCTVTDEADRQSRKLASRLARDNPRSRVVVTGCSAEVDPERLTSSKGIHYVIGNRDKPTLVGLILERLAADAPVSSDVMKGATLAGTVLGRASGYSEMVSRHPMDREWSLPEHAVWIAPEAGATAPSTRQTQTTRAFLKIQEGCNSFCTYCVIPYGRGPSRSLRPREILAQVRALVSEGVREIVLTGTNIGDYGTDWGEGPALVELLELIFAESGLERLRLSSLDPTEILMPGLIELMEREPRFCPHFHVSLQSPHSRILRLMKRRYSFDEVKRCLERIAAVKREEPVFVGMDVITGFPGESDSEFDWGMERLRELPWTRLHVFPYSERAGTPATRLPGAVPQAVRVERARSLQALSLERIRAHAQSALTSHLQQGLPISHILCEAHSDNDVFGYTPGYLRVCMTGLKGKSLRNQVVSGCPLGVESDLASGEAWVVAQIPSIETAD